jgi:hypothetical protein
MKSLDLKLSKIEKHSEKKPERMFLDKKSKSKTKKNGWNKVKAKVLKKKAKKHSPMKKTKKV